MNKIEKDIIIELSKKRFENQRMLAEDTGYSVGKINMCLKTLVDLGMIRDDNMLTDAAKELLQANTTKSAVILAAGGGMRMAPINTEMSKGLLKVKGEVLIERTIRQLHEAGIYDITIVVGFMKESYEYLIDDYHVKLRVNMEYGLKNNLHSLAKAVDDVSDTYIIPCDIWFAQNPYHQQELYSWYMVTEALQKDSTVRINRKGELSHVAEMGNEMVGVAYVNHADAGKFREMITRAAANQNHDREFWECILEKEFGFIFYAKKVSEDTYKEINTYEELRELDSDSSSLKTDAMEVITDVFGVEHSQIFEVAVLKKGMTNRSFRFRCKDGNYIMRIPGEGTEQLINRRQEYAVYKAIHPLHICDEVFYMDPDNGYKISELLPDAKVCDPGNWKQVDQCIKMLKDFHKKKLKVEHRFDVYQQIAYYESLWQSETSIYCDYATTKEHVLELKRYIDENAGEEILCHIDANCDNFLFAKGRIYLIDWEYAGMQDPNVDIAMFAIYAMYNPEEVERLIQSYYPEGCDRKTRKLIYCYISACGLLWSNWCEYKRQFGVEFGEYSLMQYRYAKEYYRYFKEMEEEDVQSK